MESSFIETMYLTFKVSLITTLILLPIGIFLGYILAYYKRQILVLLEVIIWMPLVLPPSVLGFYLLVTFSPNSTFGSWLLNTFDLKLVFSFEGIILASVIFSLPFMVNPIKNGFNNLAPSLKETSYIFGKGKFYTLIFVLIPNIKSSILLGVITSFVHTIGEFGVVMMIGGNIQGQTRVASIAIYDEVESLNIKLAHQYSLTLFIITFTLLFIIFYINKKYLKE